MADFLLEIGMDEIPARMIARAEEELAFGVKWLLASERLLDLTGSRKVCCFMGK